MKQELHRQCTVMNLQLMSLEDLSPARVIMSLHAFTLDELKSVPKNFSTSNLLGKAGFDPVYEGFVDDDILARLALQ